MFLGMSNVQQNAYLSKTTFASIESLKLFKHTWIFFVNVKILLIKTRR